MTFNFSVEARAIALLDICSTLRTCENFYLPKGNVTYIYGIFHKKLDDRP